MHKKRDIVKLGNSFKTFASFCFAKFNGIRGSVDYPSFKVYKCSADWISRNYLRIVAESSWQAKLQDFLKRMMLRSQQYNWYSKMIDCQTKITKCCFLLFRWKCSEPFWSKPSKQSTSRAVSFSLCLSLQIMMEREQP